MNNFCIETREAYVITEGNMWRRIIGWTSRFEGDDFHLHAVAASDDGRLDEWSGRIEFRD